MVNYREIVQHPAVKESDYSPDFALPIQSETEPPIVGAKKIGLPLLAEFIGRLLEFLPNKTRNKAGSVGVLDDAMVAVTGSASLDMSGDANIKFGLGVNLHSKGAGAISGLQGTIKDTSSLSVYCRVYKINGNFNAQTTNADITNSFSTGDVFYFVAAPELQESATLSYRNASGIEEEALMDKENSLVLILVQKRNTELLFQKTSDTSLVQRIHKALLEHINDPEIHIDQSEREYWNGKANQSALEAEVLARKEADAELSEKVKAIWQPTGKDNQVMLGSGEPTPFNANRDAASSLLNYASLLGKDADYVICMKGDRCVRIRWRDFILSIAAELINAGAIPRPPDISEISSVSLSIEPPANGAEQNNEVIINDNDPNYEVSEILWEPYGIVNSTQTYTASFSIIPISSMDEAFEFADNIVISVNEENPASINRETNGALNITKVFPPTMTALPIPSLSITEPAYGDDRPSEAVQNDEGKDNYTNSILWTPEGATFPEGVSTGDFSLIAEPEYRWNESKAKLNNVEYNGNLSESGKVLTFMSKFSIESPLAYRSIEVKYVVGSEIRIGYAGSVHQLVYNNQIYLNDGVITTMNSIIGVEFLPNFNESYIPDEFLSRATSLTGLTMPSSIVSIGADFLSFARNLRGLVWNTPALPPADPTSSTDIYAPLFFPSLCWYEQIITTSSSAPSKAPSLPSPTPVLYDPGPTISGTYASQLKSHLSNKSGTRIYRKHQTNEYEHLYTWRKLR
ncbi:MAG: hypothetical protein LBC87_04085 [Fibromonadaceae bacterium]|jgi:hypothetical protein|nr:hypothetical protein [Fibromonadaceae bacterium]